MALIDKETIRKEIERRCVCENTEINRKRLNRVIIESSKRWQPVEGLEEAARHSEILTYPMPEDGDIEKVMKAQEARIFHEIGFKAGAEWMKSKMLIESSKKEVDEFMSRCDRDVLDELNRWRFTTACQEFIEQGIFDYGCAKHFTEWMKAKMLEGAVEGVAHPDDCEIWVNLVGYGYKFKDGDKVRVIVIKED